MKQSVIEFDDLGAEQPLPVFGQHLSAMSGNIMDNTEDIIMRNT